MHLVFLGTYDLGKPRVRILREAARHAPVKLTECHRDVWSGVEDKSQLTGLWAKSKRLLRWFLAYPPLMWHYLRTPKHQFVIMPYLGLLRGHRLLSPGKIQRSQNLLGCVFLPVRHSRY